jgi:hypothetical protein
MGGDKISIEFEIQREAEAYLDEMVERYELPDRDKALRCLLAYAIEDGDPEDIFVQVRCQQCDG